MYNLDTRLKRFILVFGACISLASMITAGSDGSALLKIASLVSQIYVIISIKDWKIENTGGKAVYWVSIILNVAFTYGVINEILK